jgi:putative membrane protein
MALDRTVLANERTFQAWIRTGLAALVSGLGVAKFLQDTMPLAVLLIVVSILILFSALAFLLSAWRYSHLHLRIEHLDIEATPVWLAKAISIILAGCSVIALVGSLIALVY